LIGDAGSDTLYGHGGRDVLLGGSGVDQTRGGSSADLIYAGDYDADALDDDTLLLILGHWATGGADADLARDAIIGAAMDDLVNDSLHGEGDADWYITFLRDNFLLSSERRDPNVVYAQPQ
jgi:hypothetical protein